MRAPGFQLSRTLPHKYSFFSQFFNELNRLKYRKNGKNRLLSIITPGRMGDILTKTPLVSVASEVKEATTL